MAGFAPPMFPLAVQRPGGVSKHSFVSSPSLLTGSTITLGRARGPVSSSSFNVSSEKQGHRAIGGMGATYSVDELVPPLAYNLTSLNEYADTAPEPGTLAFYLFWIGFLIPLAWLVGSLLLVVPVTSLGVHDAEGGGVYGRGDPFAIRRHAAEQKWAQRCMTAASIAVCLGIVLGIAIWRGLESRGS